MRRLACAAVALAACGRLSFDPFGGDDGAPTRDDAALTDDAATAVDSGPIDAVTACPVALSCNAPMNSICNGRCITYCGDLLPQAQAENLCNFASSHLVTIRSAADDACVLQLVTTGDGVWVGYQQQLGSATTGANWSWLDGQSWSYTNWGAGEPQDVDSIEDGEEQCLVEFNDGVWRDTSCTDLRPFACVR